MHQGTKRSYRDIDSPIGPLRLVGSGDSLQYLVILKAQQLRDNVGEWIEESSGFGSIVDQLDAYFNNQTKYFSIPAILIGTDFQKQVWEELRKIPFGETRTYAEVALSIGRSKRLYERYAQRLVQTLFRLLFLVTRLLVSNPIPQIIFWERL
jgi:Methylated DNA-protein cysteine methyltransferase